MAANSSGPLLMSIAAYRNAYDCPSAYSAFHLFLDLQKNGAQFCCSAQSTTASAFFARCLCVLMSVTIEHRRTITFSTCSVHKAVITPTTTACDPQALHFLGLHQRRGQAPSTGRFSDRFLINSPAISAAQYAHTQAVIFKIAKAIRSPLDQLHFSVKSFCDAVIPRKTEHSGHFFPPIMQRLAQGAQRREGRFSKLIKFIQ